VSALLVSYTYERFGVTSRIAERQANPVTSVKLISNDNEECDTSAKAIQGNSQRAGDESWSTINSFQDIL
jgi:hypothetical protein